MASNESNLNRYDEFSESQMATMCRMRNLQPRYDSWLGYTYALLADDQNSTSRFNSDIGLAVTRAVEAANRISNQAKHVWRISTHGGVSMLVEERLRRHLAYSPISDISSELPSIETENLVEGLEATRPRSTGH
jgi:hypothetical protein